MDGHDLQARAVGRASGAQRQLAVGLILLVRGFRAAVITTHGLQVTPIWMLFNTSEDDPDVKYLRGWAQGRRSKRRKRSRA